MSSFWERPLPSLKEIEDPWDKYGLKYPDIFCYLIESTSKYTGETLNAYSQKS